MILMVYRSPYRAKVEFERARQASDVRKSLLSMHTLWREDGEEVRYIYVSTLADARRYSGLAPTEVIFGDYLPEPEPMQFLRSLVRSPPEAGSNQNPPSTTLPSFSSFPGLDASQFPPFAEEAPR